MPPGFKSGKRQLPFVLLDTDEMALLTLLQEWNALPHQRIRDNHSGPWFGMQPGGIESCDHRIEIVAVDPLHEPAEGHELVDQRLESHDLRRRTVRLLIVDVDDSYQI